MLANEIKAIHFSCCSHLNKVGKGVCYLFSSALKTEKLNA